MASTHFFYGANDRCTRCGLDKRTATNVLCDVNNLAVASQGEGFRQGNASYVEPGASVSRPSPRSEPLDNGSFADTPDYDDYVKEAEDNYEGGDT